MSTTATQYQILIGGELAEAASGETMEVIAPATGETIAEVLRSRRRRPRRRSGSGRLRRSARSSSSSSRT